MKTSSRVTVPGGGGGDGSTFGSIGVSLRGPSVSGADVGVVAAGALDSGAAGVLVAPAPATVVVVDAAAGSPVVTEVGAVVPVAAIPFPPSSKKSAFPTSRTPTIAAPPSMPTKSDQTRANTSS